MLIYLYIFNNAQLCRILVSYAENHINDNQYIQAYNSYVEMLTKKYGTPLINTEVWFDDSYRGDYRYYGYAVSMGYLTYFSSWELKDCEVYNILNGDNFECKLHILINSKLFEQPESDSGI